MKNVVIILTTLLCLGQTAEARTCGGANQRPCALLTREFFQIGSFCEDGLDHIPFVMCAPKVSSDQVTRKIEKIGELAWELRLAFDSMNIENLKTMIRVVESAQNGADMLKIQRAIEGDPRFDKSYALMRELGMNTMTIGIAGGGSLIVGGGGEGGVALDTNKVRQVNGYGSSYTSVGLQVGVGADVVASGYIAQNHKIGGDAVGTSAYVDAGPGVGFTLWYDTSGTLSGFSVPVGLIGAGAGIANVNATTSVWGVNELPPREVTDPPGGGGEPDPPKIVTREVALGDTLWRYAEETYGDGKLYPMIYQANTAEIRNADLIYPGQIVIVPQL